MVDIVNIDARARTSAASATIAVPDVVSVQLPALSLIEPVPASLSSGTRLCTRTEFVQSLKRPSGVESEHDLGRDNLDHSYRSRGKYATVHHGAL